MTFLSKLTRNTAKWALLSLFVLLAFAGCKNEELIKPGDPINVAYKKALHLYRTEQYSKASTAFETVINSARGTDYARSAHFFAAESYFHSQQYLLATDAYERFISLYPQSPKREQAAYKNALAYYKLSPRYKIDQKYSRKAIEKFQLFLSRYPNSTHAEEAGQYITDMRAKLAHKNFSSAQLYRRLDQYKASAIYYNLTVDQYPESTWAEKALVYEIGLYVQYARKSIKSSQRKRYQKAIDTYEKYLQLFPKGAHRSRAEDNVDKARKGLADMGPVSTEKSDKLGSAQQSP